MTRGFDPITVAALSVSVDGKRTPQAREKLARIMQRFL